MESRFGHDFGSVRIYTDGRATDSARRLNARAYTVGHSVVFASGEYAPGTRAGTHLLAHELAHVIQQNRGGTRPTPPTARSAPERATERAARAVVGRRRSVRVAHATAPGIARQPRSLVQSVDPRLMSPAELVREIQLIREWLAAHPASSPDRLHLESVLTELEAHREGAGIEGQRYNLTIAGQELRNATHEEVVAALRNAGRRLQGLIRGDRYRHEGQKEVRDEHYIVGAISDLFGGVDLPPLSIWDEPTRRLREMEIAVMAGDVSGAIRAFEETTEAWQQSHVRLYEYINGTIEGAERAVTGLEVTRDVSFATVGTIATGGYGLAAGTAISVGVTATGTIAQQAQEVNLGLREEIDWGEIAFNALFEVITARIPGLGGKVAERLRRMPAFQSLGRRAFAVLTEEVIEVIQDQLTGAVQTVVFNVFNNLRGSENAMTTDQLLDTVARQLLDPESVMRNMLVSRASGAVGSRATSRLPRSRGSRRPRQGSDATRSDTDTAEPPVSTPAEPAPVPRSVAPAPDVAPATPSTPPVGPVARPLQQPAPVGGTAPPPGSVPPAPRPRRVASEVSPAVEPRTPPPERPAPRQAAGETPQRRPEVEAEAVTARPAESGSEAPERRRDAEAAADRSNVTRRTRDGEHELALAETGRIIRCSDRCQDLAMRYREVLNTDRGGSDLNDRLQELQSRARRAAEEGDAAAQERVLADARALEADLQAAEVARMEFLGMSEAEIDAALDAMERGEGERPIITRRGNQHYIHEGLHDQQGRPIPYHETREVVDRDADGTPILSDPLPEQSRPRRRRIDAEDVMRPEEVAESRRRSEALAEGRRRPDEGVSRVPRRITEVIGRRIDQVEPLRDAWNRARDEVLGGRAVDDFSPREVTGNGGLYDQVRDRFWDLVRENPSASGYLTDRGFEFPSEGRAPLAELGPVGRSTETGHITDQERRVSLDHIREKAQGDNWRRALDADNLEFTFQNANAEREIVQRRHRMREHPGGIAPPARSGSRSISRGVAEAYRRGYPTLPPPGYHWRVSSRGTLYIQNNPGNTGPRIRYLPGVGFVERE
jgi:hypothetical protein